MAFMKYFIVAFGFFASGLMWWKILTTPDIPWPVFQGVVYSLVMAMFVWMALGFPAINLKRIRIHMLPGITVSLPLKV